jgi:hypothetical protein
LTASYLDYRTGQEGYSRDSGAFQPRQHDMLTVESG